MIPSLLPLLETLFKIFNGKIVKGHQRFLLNFCNVHKTLPFQILFQPWEQKKVTRSKVRWVGSKTTSVTLAKTEAFRSLVALDRMLQNGNGIERREVTLHGLHSVYKILKWFQLSFLNKSLEMRNGVPYTDFSALNYHKRPRISWKLELSSGLKWFGSLSYSTVQSA